MWRPYVSARGGGLSPAATAPRCSRAKTPPIGSMPRAAVGSPLSPALLDRVSIGRLTRENLRVRVSAREGEVRWGGNGLAWRFGQGRGSISAAEKDRNHPRIVAGSQRIPPGRVLVPWKPATDQPSSRRRRGNRAKVAFYSDSRSAIFTRPIAFAGSPWVAPGYSPTYLLPPRNDTTP